jgi:Uma2 family endonuclease
MTVVQFIEQRFELPDSGQWSELVRGLVELLQPPDEHHGNAVLNLSKALAAYMPATAAGYACFDLGVQLAFHPDTVRFPAACYFSMGPRFAEADKPWTTTLPAIVIELASTNDRRQRMPQRLQEYLDAGVGAVWILDPRTLTVCVHRRGAAPREWYADEVFDGGPELPGFQLTVRELFAPPGWWLGGSKPAPPK